MRPFGATSMLRCSLEGFLVFFGGFRPVASLWGVSLECAWVSPSFVRRSLRLVFLCCSVWFCLFCLVLFVSVCSVFVFLCLAVFQLKEPVGFGLILVFFLVLLGFLFVVLVVLFLVGLARSLGSIQLGSR